MHDDTPRGRRPGSAPLARQGELRPARRGSCRFSNCTEPPSSRYPTWLLCQTHILHIWGTVQADIDSGEQPDPNAEQKHPWIVRAEMEAEAEAQRKRAKTPGTIYYLRVGPDIKIGWTSDLYGRLRQYPPTAELLAIEPGTRAHELGLHRRFAEYRVAGREWYRKAQPVMEHIKAVAESDEPFDPRDPIRVIRETPQEQQARSVRHARPGTRVI